MIKKYKGFYNIDNKLDIHEDYSIFQVLNLLFKHFNLNLKINEIKNEYPLLNYYEDFIREVEKIPYVIFPPIFIKLLEKFRDIDETSFSDKNSMMYFKNAIFNEMSGVIVRKLYTKIFNNEDFIYTYGVFIKTDFSVKEDFFKFIYKNEKIIIKKRIYETNFP